MELSENKNKNIRYFDGDESMLPVIKPLWEGLNAHHQARSPYFKEEYGIFTFEIRLAFFAEKAIHSTLHVHCAADADSDQLVGYCVSSLEANGTGELESLFVHEDYRKCGVADCLVRSALAWMDQNGAREKKVMVAAGNEEAFGFYSRYGFFPRMTILKQK